MALSSEQLADVRSFLAKAETWLRTDSTATLADFCLFVFNDDCHPYFASAFPEKIIVIQRPIARDMFLDVREPAFANECMLPAVPGFLPYFQFSGDPKNGDGEATITPGYLDVGRVSAVANAVN